MAEASMNVDSKPPLRPTVYSGTFLHSTSLGTVEVIENSIVGVDEHGVIQFVERDVSEDDLATLVNEKHGWGKIRVVRGRRNGRCFWFPGFIDTHIHASQTPNAGIFGKSTLLSWLETYTFPLESSFSSTSVARKIYTRCILRTLSHGTTCAAYYATTHVPSTNLLASICLAMGQRAFIGRCNMDSHINPEYYRDPSPQEAHDANLATIAHIKEIDPSHALITPILTPRFAPSCTSPLLAHLGALHSESTYPIQTHISENPSEVSLVKSLFPDSNDYASVYDAHGLLTSHTILAHAIHLTDSEISLIKSRGAKISHCPVSNTSLSSGLCPVRKLLDSGIEVGLGTDVSGGWSPSILVAAREAGTVSRILAAVEGEALAKRLENEATPSTTFTSTDLASPGEEDEDRKNKNNSAATSINHVKLSVEETLHLATRGGAACLGLSHKLGSFEPGKDFDAQYIDLGEIVGASEASGGEASGSNESRGGEAPLTETSPDQQHQQLQTQTQTQEDSETRDSEQAEAEAKQEHHLTHLATQLHEKGGVDLWGTETWEEKLAKWVFTGDERNTRAVWVAGRLVWGGMVGG